MKAPHTASEVPVCDIVYVEDNQHDVSFLLRASEKHNFTPNFAVLPDGAQALVLFEAMSKGELVPPKVFLLDLHLPKISGEELLIFLKKYSILKNLPVVIFSSSKDSAEIERCVKLGGLF